MSHSFNPTFCFLCRRTAGIGFGNRYACQDCALTPRVNTVRKPDVYEQNALIDAGNKAGELLDSWNTTDLALLAEVQWIEFLKTVVTSFGESIRKQIETNAPPF